MSKRQSLSEGMLQQYRDLMDFYHEARAEDNRMVMESLSKSTASLIKDLRNQQTYERETLHRDEIVSIIRTLLHALCEAAKRYIKDPDDQDKCGREMVKAFEDALAKVEQ